MNKKIKNLFLAGALVLGLAGVAVSCTDYDDDINKLQSDQSNISGQVSTLQSTVQQLQNAINAGAVITGVSALSGEPGGWKFTTSDGKSYEVTNGAKGEKGDPGKDGEDGEDGKDGKDGKDGIWFTPDATTGTWIKHEIVDGEEVTTDTEQSILPEGFINVEFDNETNTLKITAGEEEFEIKLNGSSASFVFIPDVVVDGVNGMEIKSFNAAVYQPVKADKLDSKDEKWETLEATAKEGFEKYVKDSEIKFADETEEQDAYVAWSVENGYMVAESVPAVAKYYVNSDLPFSADDEYAIVQRDVKVLTRTPQSDDYGMQAEFVSYENGVLSVNVTYVGRPAAASKTDNHMTVFALQVTKDGKTYTSDFATFISNEISAPKIADPFEIVKKHKASRLASYLYEEHYRRGTAGISGTDKGSDFGDYDDANTHEYFANTNPAYVAPWVVSEENTEEGFAFAKSTCDTTVAYEGTLDLNAITIPHYVANGDFCFKPMDCGECVEDETTDDQNQNPDGTTEGSVTTIDNDSTVGADEPANSRTRAEAEELVNCLEMTREEMEEFGLHFEYEVVKNFVTGKPATDQANFVVHEDYKIEDGIFKPRVYETEGVASIGRTPIIRVKLMHGEDIINVAYIKVFIDKSAAQSVEVELIPRRDGKDDGENVFHWSCDGDSLMTTVHDMNVYVYNPTMEKTAFHLLYDTLVVVLPEGVKDTIGTLEDVCIDPVEGTHVIKWTLSPGELWEYAGEEVSIIGRYANKKNLNVGVNILLTATVGDDISKTVKLNTECFRSIRPILKHSGYRSVEHIANTCQYEQNTGNFNMRPKRHVDFG